MFLLISQRQTYLIPHASSYCYIYNKLQIIVVERVNFEHRDVTLSTENNNTADTILIFN